MNLPPFEAVLRDNALDVRRYLVAGVGPQEADDCFQDVMLSALNAYPALRDATNLRGWLFTIAYRKTIDVHRRGARRRVLVAAAAAEPELPVAHPRLPDDELWVAVRELPPKQRAAVLHRFLHDLPYREIAAIIGCSEAAARQNVRAGLAALREVYQR